MGFRPAIFRMRGSIAGRRGMTGINVCLRSNTLGWLKRMAEVRFGPLVAVSTIYKRQFLGMVIGRRTEIDFASEVDWKRAYYIPEDCFTDPLTYSKESCL